MHRRSLCLVLVLSACPKDPGGATDSATDPATDPATSDATDGASVTGAPASTDPTTGPDDPTGTTQAPPDDCVQLMQGSTDPPLPSGWEQCGDKLPHRAEALACAVPATPGTCDPDATIADCHTAADCTARPFGACRTFFDMFGDPSCGCTYGCETDADCGPGNVCRCAGDGLGPYTECISSACTDDAACAGGRCQFADSYGNGCPVGVNSGACTTPTDSCDSDLQCDAICSRSPGGWQCFDVVC